MTGHVIMYTKGSVLSDEVSATHNDDQGGGSEDAEDGRRLSKFP